MKKVSKQKNFKKLLYVLDNWQCECTTSGYVCGCLLLMWYFSALM